MLAWLTLAWDFVKTIFGLGQPDVRNQERDAGIQSGKAQQAASDEGAEIVRANQTVETEHAVGQAAVDGPSDIDEAIEQARNGIV